MKYIIYIAFLNSVMTNTEVQRREVCLSCDILQQCEQIVCNNILINGTFLPDYVIGCELACPFGNISCQKDDNGTYIWQPEDPCLPEISTTTSEVNNSSITSTTTPFSTVTSQVNTTTDLVHFNTTTFFVTYQTDSQNMTIDTPLHTNKDVNTSRGWTLYWLIPLILCITIPIFFFICLILHYLQKRKQTAEFSLSKTYTTDIIDPSASSWVNYYKTGNLFGQTGLYRKNRTTICDINESSNKLDEILTAKQKLSLSKYTKLKLTHKKCISPTLHRKPINWQESGTYEFAIPPSPKSASSINMTKTSSNNSPCIERNYSQNLYNLRYSSSQFLSGTPTISLKYSEGIRSVSQCSMLLPKQSNLHDTLLLDYYHSDDRTMTTFNRHNNHLQQVNFISNNNNQTHRMNPFIIYNDNDYTNIDTCDQMSSITIQPTVQQLNSDLLHNHSFNAFINYEQQSNMYNSQYNEWTGDETMNSRIPRI
ncbi:hypothetical protein EWB00_001245 [Schistosoma japonicum]|uniref:Uncharacterized protein n=1 Tax=Schistosoma japonicum TaxID=6182 RepID=A0A4Z2DGA2_SCHJA|nr:hypothetical protein EWB00_001245 [Schistosoma japonicum]